MERGFRGSASARLSYRTRQLKATRASFTRVGLRGTRSRSRVGQGLWAEPSGGVGVLRGAVRAESAVGQSSPVAVLLRARYHPGGSEGGPVEESGPWAGPTRERLKGPAPLLEHDHAVGGREVIGAVSGPVETAELSPRLPWTWPISLRARRQVVEPVELDGVFRRQRITLDLELSAWHEVELCTLGDLYEDGQLLSFTRLQELGLPSGQFLLYNGEMCRWLPLRIC
ncbi:hypothetical protein NDU88_001488 [Pleurodeles waltl]|uniref:Uncharacterized protein n=1 Tax=Pleurodeles waltl TaxID=8319 RepID=A0AAV7Q9Z8_PLEWA|nr:hypothetical protein NDU88_001488 [Pleurodeles waltl]